jgi:hypothetical protein
MTTSLFVTLDHCTLGEAARSELVESVRASAGVVAQKLRLVVRHDVDRTYLEPFFGSAALIARIALKKWRPDAQIVLECLLHASSRYTSDVGVWVVLETRTKKAVLPDPEYRTIAEILLLVPKSTNRWFKVLARGDSDDPLPSDPSVPHPDDPHLR